MRRSVRASWAPLLAPLALLTLASPAAAELRLPAIFGDHMVLQREASVPVWGWAEPGETVRVEVDWLDAPLETTADAEGRWRLDVETGAAGGPHSLLVTAGESVELEDVLFGEVWLCSGQSNMEWPIDYCAPLYDELKQAADHPELRLFDVTRQAAAEPREDCEGTWRACTPDVLGRFSAVAYFYGRELQEKLGVPVGLISSNWGGTLCEAWTSEATIAERADMTAAFAPVLAAREPAPEGEAAPEGEEGPKWNHNSPTALFNGMIAPLLPFRIRGAIWYQGESNRPRPEQYHDLFPAMIADWRRHWGIGDFPFYFVQIAPYLYGGDPEHHAARLREAQRLALRVPNTGMAVTLDIGNPDDVHPKRKQEVGQRLALWALKHTYDRPLEVWSGPLFRAAEEERGELRLHFDQVGGGLEPAAGIEHFEVCGADGVWMEAVAHVEEDTVVVSADGCPHPIAARYAWGAADEGALRNVEGLPASSFTTMDWPHHPDKTR